MNEAALKKTKRELLLNSKVGKERKRLAEEYRDGIIRITNEILGEKGQELLKKYENIINYYEELLIPGQVSVRIFDVNSRYGYLSIYYDCFNSPEIPIVIRNLNNVYSYNKSEFNTDIIPEEKDKEWIKNIRNQLETNAEEYESLWDEIESIFNGMTEKDLKTFPEAYSLYIKFRNELKNEGTETVKK